MGRNAARRCKVEAVGVYGLSADWASMAEPLYQSGGLGVAGSNPAVPTIEPQDLEGHTQPDMSGPGKGPRQPCYGSLSLGLIASR